MNKDIRAYNASQTGLEKRICQVLAKAIQAGLPEAESKIWHGAPVWFLDGNPVAGYSVRKNDVQLLFWSGMSFDEPGLVPIGNVKKFKAAGAQYTSVDQIDTAALTRWLKKSRDIQWDYKNIVKCKGVLLRLKRKQGLDSIDAYIAKMPEEVQVRLKKFRQIIRAVAPAIEETIAYRMPTFRLNGKNLVHFAAYEKHIGFYPTPSGIEAFKKQLSPYKHAKGSVQFPLDKTVPFNLVKAIVAFRVKEESVK